MGTDSVKYPFFDPRLLPYLSRFTERWCQIQDEFLSLDSGAQVHPWPESNLYETKTPGNDEATRGEGWDVFGLYAFGKKKISNCNLCPITYELIRTCPVPITTATFSILRPVISVQVHVLPHSGYDQYSKNILRAHVSLVAPPVPEDVPDPDVWRVSTSENEWFRRSIWRWDGVTRSGCMFRAGDYQTSWKPGHSFVFDDVSTHEAWNYTNHDRVSLILDFPRPDHLTDCLHEHDIGHGKGLEYLDNLTRQHGWVDI